MSKPAMSKVASLGKVAMSKPAMSKPESLGKPMSKPESTSRSRLRASLAVLTIAIATVVAAACRGDDPLSLGTNPSGADPSVTDPSTGELAGIVPAHSEIRFTSTLSNFGNCDDLLQHIHTTAAARVGPYGFDSSGGFGPQMGGTEAGTGPASSAASGVRVNRSADAALDSDNSGPLFGVNFSGTNVAEIGVDEADLIKTDGKRVLVLANDELVVIDAQQRLVTGRLKLREKAWADSGTEMFLQGDDLLIVSQQWPSYDPEPQVRALPDDIDDQTNLTLISRVELTDGDPVLVSGLVIEGSYVDSRSIDGVARIIVRSHPDHNLGFVYPENEQGHDAATRINREAVLATELSDWLPRTVRFDNRGYEETSTSLLGCEQVHVPTVFAGFGVLSVLSIPVDGDIDIGTTTAVLAPGEMTYASTQSVFVATQAWIDVAASAEDPDISQRALEARETAIHRFELSSNSAAYTASGSVPGDLHNQFSMSEYDGHLRVVTSTGDPWDGSSETFLRVLRESEGELIEIGSVGDMGKGETVQSVRLIGDVGYVVTFEQVDPFYTLDLSDHTDPRVVGELKIPGFSSYLHPIGNGRVIGVGSDATEQGRVTGSKVSLFDVNDPADPREVAVWTLPDGWSYIGWDHHSFLWWEPEQVAVIPFETYTEDHISSWAGAVVLRIDGNEIIETGRIDHDTSDTDILGRTDCTFVTADDIHVGENENIKSLLEKTVLESTSQDVGQVIICGPDDRTQVTGYECFADEFLSEEAEWVGIDFTDSETIALCWPTERMPIIGRTMVIDGDEFWSISGRWRVDSSQPARVQINDLTSLARLDAIEIG